MLTYPADVRTYPYPRYEKLERASQRSQQRKEFRELEKSRLLTAQALEDVRIARCDRRYLLAHGGDTQEARRALSELKQREAAARGEEWAIRAEARSLAIAQASDPWDCATNAADLVWDGGSSAHMSGVETAEVGEESGESGWTTTFLEFYWIGALGWDLSEEDDMPSSPRYSKALPAEV